MAERTSAGFLMALVLAACGGAPAATSSTLSAETTVASVAATTAPTLATTTTIEVAPSILSVSSGRGDDGSLETAIWLAADPFTSDDYRVIVGTDADDSYPGTGDPLPHLDGYLEITATGSTLYDDGVPVATGGDLVELASWGHAEGVLRVFFIGTVPAKAGTTWVIVTMGDAPVVGGTAGAPFGTACSYHSAGLNLANAQGGVPDVGTACRYPMG